MPEIIVRISRFDCFTDQNTHLRNHGIQMNSYPNHNQNQAIFRNVLTTFFKISDKVTKNNGAKYIYSMNSISLPCMLMPFLRFTHNCFIVLLISYVFIKLALLKESRTLLTGCITIFTFFLIITE